MALDCLCSRLCRIGNSRGFERRQLGAEEDNSLRASVHAGLVCLAPSSLATMSTSTLEENSTLPGKELTSGRKEGRRRPLPQSPTNIPSAIRLGINPRATISRAFPTEHNSGA